MREGIRDEKGEQIQKSHTVLYTRSQTQRVQLKEVSVNTGCTARVVEKQLES